MKARLAHALAVWFGCGLVPVAPGLAGMLGAIPLYLVLRPLGPLAVTGAAIVLTAIDVWAAGDVEHQPSIKDRQIVCIEDVAGVFVTWMVAPPYCAGLCAGVVLFRIFDQFKPWPARLAEQRLRGGWGVVG